MDSFQAEYAQYYDFIYSDKDYKKECDFLEKLIARFSTEKPKRLLDLGCGTGNHAIIFARRGYKVTGVDASEAMIAIAKRKAKQKKLPVHFLISSIENLNLNQPFDVAICMFNAINYLTSQNDLLAALRKVHTHLVKEGLFLFDFRNGLACLRFFERTTEKRISRDGMELYRRSENTIDPIRQLFFTTYHCQVKEKNGEVHEFKDHHILRFLFPQEITHYLEDTGFKVLHMCPFMELDAPLTPDAFNVMVVAKKA